MTDVIVLVLQILAIVLQIASWRGPNYTLLTLAVLFLWLAIAFD